jgi:hypothetical protein
VQANYDYNTAQFQFISVDANKSDFGLQAEGSGTGGHIKIARGVNAGSAAISGDRIVATVTLHAIATGTAAVTPAAGSAVVSSATNKDILTAKTGGSYTLTGGAAGGTTTPAPTPTPASVSITGSKTPIPVKSTIQIASPALSSTNGTTYQVDGKTATSTIDTTQLADGNHTITATSGDQTVKQSISVENHGTPSSPFSAVLAAAKPAAPYAGLTVLVLLLGWVGYVIFRHSQAPAMGGTSSDDTNS